METPAHDIQWPTAQCRADALMVEGELPRLEAVAENARSIGLRYQYLPLWELVMFPVGKFIARVAKAINYPVEYQFDSESLLEPLVQEWELVARYAAGAYPSGSDGGSSYPRGNLPDVGWPTNDTRVGAPIVGFQRVSSVQWPNAQCSADALMVEAQMLRLEEMQRRAKAVGDDKNYREALTWQETALPVGKCIERVANAADYPVEFRFQGTHDYGVFDFSWQQVLRYCSLLWPSS